MLPKAGKGLFAKIAYKAGEIVTISPVGVLPRHAVEAASDKESVLLNFCIVSEGTDVALFPFGLAGMANHGGRRSNMHMEWYAWSKSNKSGTDKDTNNNDDDTGAAAAAGGDMDALKDMLGRSADELTGLPYAPLDIAYRATRDIMAGEELTVYYGESWESSWRGYLDRLQVWLSHRKAGDPQDKPLFRHGIEAPSGMYPDHWRSKCIGQGCLFYLQALEEE
jgi:hypothetical protein